MDAKTLIKKMTTVPSAFIDELFEFYDEHTLQTDFVINLDHVSKWLDTLKKRLIETLKSSYKLNIDYTLQKAVNPNKKHTSSNNYKKCLLTPDCFKRLCMLSKARNADMVRTYFIEIETLFFKHKDQMIEGLQRDIQRLENNQKSKKKYTKGEGYIYVIKASPVDDSVVKIGRTKDLQHRLSNHSSSHADSLNVLYVYKADNVEAVEGCIKSYLNGVRYAKYKEVYKVDLEYVKRLIGRCDNVGRLETVYQRRKEVSSQEGGYYIALYKS
jgi:phage anti-repressor protein/predicted GIY-YIG superfamily endonuclease